MTTAKKFRIINYVALRGLGALEERQLSGCSAVGSALGSGPRGRGFESRHSDHKKLFHRLVKELFVFHGVTGFEQPALSTAGHKRSRGLFARVQENPRPFAA